MPEIRFSATISQATTLRKLERNLADSRGWSQYQIRQFVLALGLDQAWEAWLADTEQEVQ